MPRLSTLLAGRLALVVAASSVALAAAPSRPLQSPAASTDTRPAFEVASIKQNKEPGGLQNWKALPGGRFTATKMPLRLLIRLAYANGNLPLPDQQIVGAPGWTITDRFDIEAKATTEFDADPAVANRQAFAMLRTLLEDRFKLKAHLESRELPIFNLVVIKDGKLGPQLTRAAFECGPNAPPPPAGQKCGINPIPQGLYMRGVPLSTLVAYLTLEPSVKRLVRDKTGLTGNFDWRVDVVPPLILGAGGFIANPAAEGAPTVFTAVQEQLGLKLESAKGPVDVIVVEHVESLTADGVASSRHIEAR